MTAGGVALGVPPRPPLGVQRESLQVNAPAAVCWLPPLRTADHPATPWWSALLRGFGEGRRGLAMLWRGRSGGRGGGGDEREKEVGVASALWVEDDSWSTHRSIRKREKDRDTDERRAGSGVQITSRDVAAISWITEQYAVRTDVIRWLLGNGQPLSDSRTRAVVARWQRAGLVESRRFFAGAPNVVWPTRAGTTLVRPGWRARPPVLSMLAHHHAVSRVRLAIERRGQGADWVCERVLYNSGPRPTPTYPTGSSSAAVVPAPLSRSSSRSRRLSGCGTS